MTLLKHSAANMNGRPIYSLEIPDGLSELLKKAPADWPILELERPLTILVLCDFTTRNKIELHPLAEWLCGLGAVYVLTWGGTGWPSQRLFVERSGSWGEEVRHINEAELCWAIDDYVRDKSLELFARAMEDGLELAETEGVTDVRTTSFGRIELEDALEGFFYNVEMSDAGRASRSLLVVSIGNGEWAVRVRQLLDDDKWLAKFDYDDEPSDGT